jgi:virginiamycin B lyase
MTVGPDGALWFTEAGYAEIGRISTAGTITEYALPAEVYSVDIVTGPDGALWFTEQSGGGIGRITTNGTVTQYPLPQPPNGEFASTNGIAAGADGALWYPLAYGSAAVNAEPEQDAIGRITTAGMTSAVYAVPTLGCYPIAITGGPDGALWFTESDSGKIGRITLTGSVTEYRVSSVDAQPVGIVSGPDGALWFTEREAGDIGRISDPFSTTSGNASQTKADATINGARAAVR